MHGNMNIKLKPSCLFGWIRNLQALVFWLLHQQDSRFILTFRRNVLPLSSGRLNMFQLDAEASTSDQDISQKNRLLHKMIINTTLGILCAQIWTRYKSEQACYHVGCDNPKDSHLSPTGRGSLKNNMRTKFVAFMVPDCKSPCTSTQV
jgi:hypothetical protein